MDLRRGGHWQKEPSGIKFLLALHKAREVEGYDDKMFLCPGTQDENHGGKDYDDWDSLDPNSISYAGRDTQNYPIEVNELAKMRSCPTTTRTEPTISTRRSWAMPTATRRSSTSTTIAGSWTS